MGNMMCSDDDRLGRVVDWGRHETEGPRCPSLEGRGRHDRRRHMRRRIIFIFFDSKKRWRSLARLSA
eukprot:6151780-Pyramimonas_sp.AAC.1